MERVIVYTASNDVEATLIGLDYENNTAVIEMDDGSRLCIDFDQFDFVDSCVA